MSNQVSEDMLDIGDEKKVTKKSFISEYLIKKDLKNSKQNRTIISTLLDNVAISLYETKSQIFSYLDRRLLGFFRSKKDD